VFATIANQSDNTDANVSLQTEATDADGDWPLYSATGLPPGLSIGEETGLITGKSATEGTYGVIVTAEDGRGRSDSQSFSWSISTKLPPAPLPRNGDSGGGSGWWLLLLLLPAISWRLRVRRGRTLRNRV